MSILNRAVARSVVDVWQTENRLLHALSYVRRPAAVQWLVTAACDMKCPHCYSAAGKRAQGELSTREAKELLIDPLVEIGCGMLVLAGGELLLREDIGELVEYATGKGLSWAMHTHGLHVMRHRALFARHPPALAAISLDGDRSFHDAFRGRAGSFDAALQAAEVLSDAGCGEVVLGTTVTRDNADLLADLFQHVVGSRADSWGLHLFAPEGRGHDHRELFPTPAQLRRVAAFARRRRGLFPIELCNEWGSAGDDDLYYRDAPFACGAGSISFVVSATGDVLPCTTTDPAEREGNVRERSLGEIWAQGFQRFRSGSCLEKGECWLQSRNGVRTSGAAFGDVQTNEPLWVERLPTHFVPQWRLRRPRVISERGAAALGLVASGLVFLQACTKPASAPGSGAPASSTTGPSPSPSAAPSRAQAPDAPRAEVALAPGEARWPEPPVASSEFPTELERHPEAHYAWRMRLGGWEGMRRALSECEADPSNCEAARNQLPHNPLSERSELDAPTQNRLLLRHVDAMAQGVPTAFDAATQLLTLLESHPAYDGWYAAHLWRAARAGEVTDIATSRARVLLYAHLHRHHRVVDTMKRAEAATSRVEILPWRKKSGPSATPDRVVLPKDLLGAAKAAFPKATATTWDTLGATVTIKAGQVELARAGKVRTLAADQGFQFGRLDVVWCAAATTLHAGTRSLAIAAATEVTLFELPQYLNATDRTELAEWVERAADGDAIALGKVEAEIGLTHALVRKQLALTPNATGAPGLRMVLVAFDE
jgi:MoaA/NifB/PqqE/SkfB family radical SAM enzyme